MDYYHSEEIARQPVTSAFSLELKLFAFVYRGGHINLWNWEENFFVGTCKKPYPFHAESLVFRPAPDTDTLAASYGGGDIYVFLPLEGNIKANYHVRSAAPTLACSQDGRTLISGDSLGTIWVFDFVNFEDKTLKIFYVIHGRGDHIQSLSFFGDGFRFADIRGLQSNVWEPAALVRAGFGDEISDADLQEQSILPGATEIDAIMAMIPHSNGRFIFCGTENGLVHAFSAEMGRFVQTLYKHSLGVSITKIASADLASKASIRQVVGVGPDWKITSSVLDLRMDETIEDLGFSPDGSRLLIVTTTQDTLCIFGRPGSESKFISLNWTTRNRGIWTWHPSDPSQLLLTVNGLMRIYSWNDLHEIKSGTGIKKGFELPHEHEIQKIHVGWRGRVLVSEYSSVTGARARVHLVVWAVEYIQPGATEVQPHPMLQAYGTRLARLIGSSGKIIGAEREHLFFLDNESWICSVKMELDHVPELYRRHFFLPLDCEARLTNL